MDSRRNAAKGTISIFVFGFHPHAAFAWLIFTTQTCFQHNSHNSPNFPQLRYRRLLTAWADEERGTLLMIKIKLNSLLLACLNKSPRINNTDNVAKKEIFCCRMIIFHCIRRVSGLLQSYLSWPQKKSWAAWWYGINVTCNKKNVVNHRVSVSATSLQHRSWMDN